MSRSIGVAVSLVAALLTALALASFTSAQEPPEDPAATQSQGDADSPATADDPAAAQDEDIEELEEVPEDEGATEEVTEDDDPAQNEESDGAAQEKSGESETAGAVDRDCEDFKTQADAQDYFTDEGGDDINNVDGLDEDGDGVVCETLGDPSGGVDAGAGGTAPRPESSSGGPLPFLLGGGVLGLALGAFSLIGRRRRVGA